MGYCTKGQQVSVKITAPSNNSIQHFATAPIDIDESDSDNAGNICWRFQQIGNGSVLLEYFGCGKAANLVFRQSQPGQPDVSQYNLYIDNVLQVGETYFYVKGTDNSGNVSTISISTVNLIVPQAGNQSIGNCNCLSGGCCTLIMRDDDSGNQLFKNTYPVTCDKVNYQVACDGCLPGQLQCICDNYPGYCCVDCAPIESKIETMTQQVKRLVPFVG